MRYLILTVLILFIAGSANSSPVDPSDPNGITSIVFIDGSPSGGGKVYILDIEGTVWFVDWDSTNDDWRVAGYGLPVPPEQITDWNITGILTQDGDIYLGSISPNRPAIWTLLPPFEGGPISGQSETLGGVKSMFR